MLSWRARSLPRMADRRCVPPAPSHRPGFPRRSLPGVLALPLASPTGEVRVLGSRPELVVHPRQDWAKGRMPTGRLERERAGDVRFLLVHHSVSPNDYAQRDVPGLIRGFYQAHTGPKSWPDVAYNFFVDRFGGVWEGRAGSLAGPVKPDATGGSQGFAQLCCLIGDHRVQAPTNAARQAMTALLAMLADRYDIDTTPGTRVTFVSRGSNKWPPGATVVTNTIAAHRDMSLTECPGDAAYALVKGALARDVSAVRGAAVAPTPPPAGTQGDASPSVSASRPSGLSTAPTVQDSPGREPPWPMMPAVTGATLSAAAVIGGLVWARRRRRPEVVSAGEPARHHWTVLSSQEAAGGYLSRTACTHGWNARMSYGCVIQAPQPTAAVSAAVRACHRASDEFVADSAPLDPVGTATTWAAKVWRAGQLAYGLERPAIDIALLLNTGFESVLVTTNDAMGAILTTTGVVLSPRQSRRQGPEDVPILLQVQQPREAIAASVLTSRILHGNGGYGNLTALCRELSSAKNPRRRLRTYEREFLGDAGFDAAVLAFAAAVSLIDSGSG